MTDIEYRQIGRDSLFLMADIRIDGRAGDHRVKVRNLSAGGMMAEGAVRVAAGHGIAINLRNIGWVSGRVAWIQDTRFGIAFDEAIDPVLARAVSHEPSDAPPRYLKSTLQQPDPRRLRKV